VQARQLAEDQPQRRAADENPEIGSPSDELARRADHCAIAEEEQRVCEVDTQEIGNFAACGEKSRAGATEEIGSAPPGERAVRAVLRP
jgi:hypothetical protein